MADRAVIDGSAQAYHRNVPVFDLIAAKLRCPQTRPGTIRRSSLIEKLARQDSGPIVSVVAPAG